jgi:hypothetical protein
MGNAPELLRADSAFTGIESFASVSSYTPPPPFGAPLRANSALSGLHLAIGQKWHVHDVQGSRLQLTYLRLDRCSAGWAKKG